MMMIVPIQPEPGDDRLHERYVRAIERCIPNAQVGGFMQHVRSLLPDWSAIREEGGLPGIVPDAWAYCSEARQLFAYEVVESHPLKDEKIDRYLQVWQELDGWCVDLNVVEYMRGHPTLWNLSSCFLSRMAS